MYRRETINWTGRTPSSFGADYPICPIRISRNRGGEIFAGDFEIAPLIKTTFPISIDADRPGPSLPPPLSLVRAVPPRFVRVAILPRRDRQFRPSSKQLSFFSARFSQGAAGVSRPAESGAGARRCGRTAVAHFLTPRPRFSCPSRTANGRPVSQLHNRAGL